MKAETTALIIVDDNNDFLSKEGKLHSAVKPMLENNHFIATLNQAVTKARSSGVKIIRVSLGFDRNYPELLTEPYGIFDVIKSSKAFQKDTWGAEVSDTVEGMHDDIVISNKSTLCSFASTNLEEVLRNNQIDTIAVTGLLTNLCVESTMRTAYDKGFKVIGLKDCTAALASQHQASSVENNWPLFSEVLTSEQFLGRIQA